MEDLLLSTIGFLFCLYHIEGFFDFIWLYFLRPIDTYKRYLAGPLPYALITGATDGIGKALAKELYNKGFNLIIHGRNEEKILSVIDELKNTSPSGGDVKYFVADACRFDVDFEGIAKRFQGLNITLVVNNVGATKILPERYWICTMKIGFPCRLTRTCVFPQGSTNGPRKSISSRSKPTQSFRPSSLERSYLLSGTQLGPVRCS